MSPESWLPSAQVAGGDFPLANLPYGAFRLASGDVRLGVAIGDQILDLYAAAVTGALPSLPESVRDACRQPVLNALMALGPAAGHDLRLRLQALLSTGDAAERDRAAHWLVPQAGAAMQVPATIGDYTDFYASIDHATNVGRLFRPANPLMPNYKYVPVGYHGRSSSIVASPQSVRRPQGQRPGAEGEAPQVGPSRQLDYELELGIWIGAGNELGRPLPLAEADRHIFGFCLLNDWSARDLQRWEYQPLGPFLGKNFATSISPWVVTREALEPFRVARAPRPEGDPAPLAYLDDEQDRTCGALDVVVEVWFASERNKTPVRISRGNVRDLYWTSAQMLAHHTVNGCNLRPGDLLGTGTVSGPEVEARGCLLEITSAGRVPLVLPGGETRTFLEDGDEITLQAYCHRTGYPRIGFGACRGRVHPALDL
ncbi:MAG: fumarylacetoacetase [Terriglobales bacterium]